tara:strand:+ start:6479 stop:7915 length:1437 start_codon:yes stop_codon:yes gene_type:complete
MADPINIREQLEQLREEGGAVGLLAETVDRALMVGEEHFAASTPGGQALGGTISATEIANWAEQIRSGTRTRGVTIGDKAQGETGLGSWEAAEDIRRAILGYRIGGDPEAAAGILAEQFNLTQEQAEAAVAGAPGRGLQAAEGDISAAVMAAGGEWPGEHLGAPGGGIEDEDDGALDTELAFRTLKDSFMGGLAAIGLDTATINSLWTWVHGRFIADPTFTAGQAMVEIYDQPAFKGRFTGIAEMRAREMRGVPTPKEYLDREKDWATYLHQYGLADLVTDRDQMIAESYLQNIGEGEFVARLQAASEMIYEAPQAVKDTFGDWFGQDMADSMLMAAFLDPQDDTFGGDWKNWTTMKSDIAAAKVGGWSKMRLGLDAPVTEERSRAIAELGMSKGAVWERFSSLRERENLFIEKIGETDYTLEEEGVAAEFGIDTELLSGAELSNLLQRRSEQRTAAFGGGGGAMVSGARTGFGAANA